MNTKFRFFFLCLIALLSSCSNFGQLNMKGDLPKLLNEVSAVQTVVNSDFIWMINDGGNKNEIYGVSKKGNIKKVLKVNAKNNDWEDLATDKAGNLFIGDFGNNLNTRQDLVILKIKNEDLHLDKNVDVEHIYFYYPEQTKFPPKKKKLYFDTEAFFFSNDSLYLFTRSRVKDNYGHTAMYKIPARKGKHAAQKVSEYNHCKKHSCSITSADISPNGNMIVLLSSHTVLQFQNFKTDNFLQGEKKEISLTYNSQKEGVCFKDNDTLYITDEKAHGTGGNLYTLDID
jgi:hypothetical protein